MALLDVRNLSVDIRLAGGELHGVRDVSFTLEKRKTLGVVGESGSGKSLTALALMNLLPHAARRAAQAIYFDGVDFCRLSEKEMQAVRGNSVAMIFQEPMTCLNPSYTIGDQLIEALRAHRDVSSTAARERAVFLLQKVGITGAAHRLRQYPHQLSGGLRQRVMIAMALMCGPRLLIADEPTTALDVTIQAEILHLLVDLKREFDMALILITHDLGVVAHVADDVAVMYGGQIVETGPVEQLFERPLHPYTEGLLACIPIPGKTRPGEPLGSIPGTVPTLIGDTAGCTFRNRCSHAQPECASDDVALVRTADGRSYRCCLTPAQRAVR
ncbi:MAG TPA: ABC transporter ATP-binding protein [Burkholderiales bacterium]|jgi:peptide/nickel transport system ATP-binding protein|nr:ABC transporter ATP-binding protein [Burkholderiales bacterium]